MTLDEYNSLRSLKATLENAFAQTDPFWMKETLASGLCSLDAMITRGKSQHEPTVNTSTPCPQCNPTGVFKYSPMKDCICGGNAWMPTKQ